jgi:hypothetical protein
MFSAQLLINRRVDYHFLQRVCVCV